MKVNLGCGDIRLTGYVGVDVVPSPAVDVLADARSLPFADGSVEEIFSAQVVEHFFPGDIAPLFAEWARVMKPGGLLHLETPDFGYVARQYVAGQMSISLARAYVCGTVDDLNTYDRDVPESYHRTLWDEPSLRYEVTPHFTPTRVWNHDWNLHFEAVRNGA